MNIFLETSYKHIIQKTLIEKKKEKGQKLTLRKISQLIGIQYTYLSRVLRNSECQLNEDQLFKICKILDLFPADIEYVFLLRSLEITGDSERKNYLEARIKEARKIHLVNTEEVEFKLENIQEEMAYLLDPYCLLVVISLDIPRFFKDPSSLCPLLGISPSYLKGVLEKLARLQFIEFEENGLKVKKLLRSHFHYGLNHPLVRMHQQLLRNMSGTQMIKCREGEKYSLMVTFAGDDATYQKITNKYKEFITEIELLALKAKRQGVYQMNFEIHPWF